MGMFDRARAILTTTGSGSWSANGTAQLRELSLDPASPLAILQRMTGSSYQPWTPPSVSQALSVPAIQRAVSLIAGTTGTLSMQAFRNGALMDDPPRVATRPDPRETTGAFYGGTASDMAKYGEFVWWVANRDGDDIPTSLVRVPLRELKVEENKDDRLLARYKWGTKEGTRYSPANRRGAFVHVMYPIGDAFDLRGRGPLQLCGAATSVSVESQNWAANFYAGGASSNVLIKHASELSPERLDVDTWLPDPDNGLNEAQRLKAQWMEAYNNTPRVIDQNIESVEYLQPNPQGAQMLDARQANNGDAARMFGIPGSLMEYQQAGSSLTYQNLEGEFTKFVRTCLQPLYLEPIEQALSDVLTRSTSARFNVKSFLRADVKTRFEVHGIAIDKGIYDPEYAQREEGILPGDVEFAPVPFAVPQAVPTSVPTPATAALSMRDVRCPRCARLVVRASGSVEGWCRHCKTAVAA